MTPGRWVIPFAANLPDGLDAKHVLGGKGASLNEMTRAGLQVPPGFTIHTDACRLYFDNNRRWPDGFENEIREHLAQLERDTGRTFGRGSKPLLVSVRSGAAVSMPGMMDTLLNCGLTPDLAREFGDAPWYWERYLAFVRTFARIVDGLSEATFHDLDGPPSRDLAERALGRYRGKTGKDFPRQPWDLLVACINAVFASWHSERAVAYRQHHQIGQLAGTAVNIQTMWPSEVSGICFTQDPTNLAGNRLVIEASYGLGESVVSGDVAPDRFLISRDRLDRVEKFVGKKASLVAAFGETRQFDPESASLDDGQLRELVDLALKIEKHFGHPVDIEWGLAEGRFALLQARAVRGLDVALAVEEVKKDEVARLRELAKDRRRLWIAHNLGETLRAPTPLTWDIVRQFMSGSGGFGRLYQQLGYHPSPRVQAEGFLELIAGRIYADPDRLAELFWQDMPLTYDLDLLATDKKALDRAPTKFDANRTDAWFLFRLPRNLWSMWRSSRTMQAARKGVRTLFEDRVLPEFLEYIEAERRRDLKALDDRQLLDLLDDRRRKVLDDFGPESLKPGFFGGMAFDTLTALLTQLLGPNEGPTLAGTLVLALDGDVTFEQDDLLYRVAHGEAELGRFIEKFGHRSMGEMELMTPRWRENPGYLEQLVGRLKTHKGADPHAIHEKNCALRNRAEVDLLARLVDGGGQSFCEEIEQHVREARELLPYRESGKFYLMMGYELIRRTIQELGRRWGLDNDVYFLTLAELHGQRPPREILEQRKIRWQAAQRLDVPETVDSGDLDRFGEPPVVADAEELQGTSIAPGVSTGTVRVVDNPQEARDLGNDYILVCASTDPGWTPLFLNARGLVVERGGVLSHGAIVARDFGIPAVVCPGATRLLHPGSQVRVDGNRGRVQKI